jgi:hypothetical protein
LFHGFSLDWVGHRLIKFPSVFALRSLTLVDLVLDCALQIIDFNLTQILA